MSYQRDRDSATRGAGAIASRDMAHPRQARARQRQRALATLRRDRALRGATMGNSGGVVGGLGAISRANVAGGLTGPTGAHIMGGGHGVEGSGGITTPPLPPKGTGGTTPPSIKNRATHDAAIKKAFAAPPKVKNTNPPRSPPKHPPHKPYPGTNRPPPIPTPPPTDSGTSVSAPPPVTNAPLNSGTSSGGGGGGSSGGTTDPGSGTTGMPDYTPTDLPDPDDTTDTSTTSTASTGKMLLLAAGIGLGAYFLLRDSDSE